MTKKKFDLKRHIAKLEDKQSQAQLLLISGEVPKVIKPMKDAAPSKIKRLEEFKRQGYQYGTREESWEALDKLASHIEAHPTGDPTISLWFLNAMNEADRADPMDLLRKLGLIQPGRSKVVNKFDITRRMVELVDKYGLLKAQASRRCADEFGCHPETALYWYRKKDNVFETK